MATEQGEMEQADSGMSTDFPKVQEVDQSDIPHHAAADPNKETPNQVDQPGD